MSIRDLGIEDFWTPTIRTIVKWFAIGVAVTLLAIGVFRVGKWVYEGDKAYEERRERRRELVRECAAKGGTPVITFSRTGRLTGYYGCTMPQD